MLNYLYMDPRNYDFSGGSVEDVSIKDTEGGYILRVSGILTPTKMKSLGEAIDLIDRENKDLILDFDTPGGYVKGTKELVNKVINFKGSINSFIGSEAQCCSGGYYIASATDSITASLSAHVGSIGTYCVSVSEKKFWESLGFETDIISAGKFKVLGHPDKELTEEEKEELQKEINILYEDFVYYVSIGRNVSKEVIKEVGARSFYAEKAPDFMVDNLTGGIV